jgi:hypothetical protein
MRPPEAETTGQRLREPRLADPSLAGEHGDSAAKRRRVVRGDERDQAGVAPDHRRAGRAGGAGIRGRSRCHVDRRGRCDRGPLAAGGGHGVPIASQSVVSASGATPGSRRGRRPPHGTGDGTGPVAGPREQGHQRRRAGSSSGSRSPRDAAAPDMSPASATSPAVRARPRPSLDSDRARRANRRSPGYRGQNPARNGPRADACRPAVAGRGRGLEPRDRRGPRPVEGDADRSATTQPVEGRAEDDRVAGGRARIVVRFGPQHRRQLVRAYGRPRPEQRQDAMALRVSTTIGTPSTRMSMGPRTRTSSPARGGRFGRHPHGVTVLRDLCIP